MTEMSTQQQALAVQLQFDTLEALNDHELKLLEEYKTFKEMTDGEVTRNYLITCDIKPEEADELLKVAAKAERIERQKTGTSNLTSPAVKKVSSPSVTPAKKNTTTLPLSPFNNLTLQKTKAEEEAERLKKTEAQKIKIEAAVKARLSMKDMITKDYSLEEILSVTGQIIKETKSEYSDMLKTLEKYQQDFFTHLQESITNTNQSSSLTFSTATPTANTTNSPSIKNVPPNSQSKPSPGKI
jgi:hypothetical protein